MTDSIVSGDTATMSHTSSSSDQAFRTFDTDRGLFGDPHTVALCLANRYIYGVGDIRSTVEALDQWIYRRGAATTVCYCYYYYYSSIKTAFLFFLSFTGQNSQ
jgi:hypothetical protein